MRSTLKMSREQAEKFFDKKTEEDAKLSPKAFLDKKLKEAMQGLNNYGRDVKGGFGIVKEYVSKKLKKKK